MYFIEDTVFLFDYELSPKWHCCAGSRQSQMLEFWVPQHFHIVNTEYVYLCTCLNKLHLSE